MTNKPIRTLLYCEYNMTSIGLESVLKKQKGLEILTPLTPPCDINSVIKNTSVDVLVIELGLLKTSGLTLIRDLHKLDPALRVLILARKEKEPFISKCMEYGALGYISLDCSEKEFVEAITTVFTGNNYLSQTVAYPTDSTENHDQQTRINAIH